MRCEFCEFGDTPTDAIDFGLLNDTCAGQVFAPRFELLAKVVEITEHVDKRAHQDFRIGSYDQRAVLPLHPRFLSGEMILTGSRYCTRQPLAAGSFSFRVPGVFLALWRLSKGFFSCLPSAACIEETPRGMDKRTAPEAL